MRLQYRRPQLRNFATAAVGSERCRSQVIAEQVVQRAAALTHRRPLTAGVVVFDHRGRVTGPLEVVADVAGGHAAQHRCDAVAAGDGAIGPGPHGSARNCVPGLHCRKSDKLIGPQVGKVFRDS